MKLKSLAMEGLELIEIDVELTLLPGLPTLQILGVSGRPLRECGPRIKSALVKQGFSWPRTRQMVVNVRAQEGRIWAGLDLAIAAAILLETGQIKPPLGRSDWIYFGELSLEGQLVENAGLGSMISDERQNRLLTGPGAAGWTVAQLKDLSKPEPHLSPTRQQWQRPRLPDWFFSPSAADLIALIAAGEHSALLAGPAGSGKTTLAEAVHAVLPEPDPAVWLEAQRVWQSENLELTWRPKVAPHHSATALSLLGGGVPPRPGELSRAHGGVLFLDEYLEFPSRVQEALREPVEKGTLRLVKASQARHLPADFLLLAATNLCQCGALVPEPREGACPFSLSKCRSYLARLNGPMLDRFAILSFSHQWRGPRTVSLEAILQRVEMATAQRKHRGQTCPNSRLAMVKLHEMTPQPAIRFLDDMTTSERRRQSVLRVARTFADFEGSEVIEPLHLSRAKKLAFLPHLDLATLFS